MNCQHCLHCWVQSRLLRWGARLLHWGGAERIAFKRGAWDYVEVRGEFVQWWRSMIPDPDRW